VLSNTDPALFIGIRKHQPLVAPPVLSSTSHLHGARCAFVGGWFNFHLVDAFVWPRTQFFYFSYAVVFYPLRAFPELQCSKLYCALSVKDPPLFGRYHRSLCFSLLVQETDSLFLCVILVMFFPKGRFSPSLKVFFFADFFFCLRASMLFPVNYRRLFP